MALIINKTVTIKGIAGGKSLFPQSLAVKYLDNLESSRNGGYPQCLK